MAVVTTMAVVAAFLVVSVANAAAADAAERQFRLVAVSAQAGLDRVLGEAGVVSDTVSGSAAIRAPLRDDGMEHPARSILISALRSQPDIYSVYVGYGTGEFLQLIGAERDRSIATAHDAPDATNLILRAIVGVGAERQQVWTFLDGDGVMIGQRIEDAPQYDPRARPWYEGATDDATIFSDPYVFASLGEPGITASRRLPASSVAGVGGVGVGVVGVDITLTTLDTFVNSTMAVAGGGIVVLDATGRILAATDGLRTALGGAGNLPLLDTLPPLLSDIPSGLVELEGERWLVGREQWGRGGREWQMVALAPLSAFDESFRALQSQLIITALVILAFAIPLVLYLARGMTRVLSVLAGEADRVARLDFAPGDEVRTRIAEFARLADGFRVMKGTIAARTDDLNTSLERLGTIIDLNIGMSVESDINRLAELTLGGARSLSHADAGSLYLIDEERRQLEFAIVLNTSLGFQQGGTSGQSVTLRPVALYGADGEANHHNIVSHCFHTGETVNIDDAYDSTVFDFSGTRAFDEANGYRSKSFLTVPLKPRGAGIIGAMQLINATDPTTGEIVGFSSEIQRFVEALGAGAATALYNRDLIEQQKRLFDSMIKLIAGAIDAKSPYTGGHCARVPEIAMMLADAVEASDDVRYDGSDLADPAERRAFWTGAWLHDAGKVTTPDYVVDKATKLETIYNRIHEVRTRFEVVLRDAHIRMLEATAAGGDPVEQRERFRAEATALREEFAFVAECNLGGEYLSDDKVTRLREIGRRRWLRHFDDRLGLSWEELQRYPTLADGDTADLDAPIAEDLLSDKPEHIVPRGEEFEHTYGPYNFAIPVPEHLYNRGELYNLGVSRGTLTPEERFKINEHVMQTIVMLDRLPFPDDLRRVPEYAGTHHETLNGAGYPYALDASGLSIPARIMAIADIFEALTASDRPYKRAKPLSVAIDILHKFKLDGHIDPDLFDLFLTSGAYRRYAEKYLKPEQVDEVDLAKYVG